MAIDRNEFPFLETMRKYHGELDRMLYAAEICCVFRLGEKCDRKMPHAVDEVCPFRIVGGNCSLYALRKIIGDHFEQHSVVKMD